ncbi:glycogen synthase GlgA [Sulfurimonas sp. SWIR-19]|uniref:glycogen synthase GlgA n=1 Tax=Sulfurimonas sp. SWIR-19 TaxID=2878390 RepID=UPI001CF403C5|nr:glycogen synthase GlgA [Sulfurimonas sp. SWIR-19]UCN00812.1 glycogen synthase GlgA [Sulfurimonas sp. SWIR-19]
MSEKLNILFAAAEVVPFAKTGGLADVAGALPKALQKLGHNIKVVMPRYYTVETEKLEKLPAPLGVPMGIMGELWAGVYKTTLPKSKVEIYFIDYEHYFGRSGLYGDENGGYHDNDNRFVFFSKAALQLCKMLHFTPDIIHANDWHTAALPVLAKTRFVHDFAYAASVLTIHNLQHQGHFYKGVMDVMEVGWEYFNPYSLESSESVNILKGGIAEADAVTTVSKKYALEIQTPEFGFGLDGHIRVHNHKLFGILNGVDYTEWNPAVDKFLAQNYDVGNMRGKLTCKEDLQKHFHLAVRDDVPLIGFVGRFVKQKGIELIAGVINKLLDHDIQVVMLGTGEYWAEDFFSEVARFRDNFALHAGYSNELAHKIEAGSDMFLMPSLFEPCGLNQIYSLRYGTLPIVRATGGLDDTIINFDAQHKIGNGFKFYDATAEALYNTVLWAVDVYNNKKEAFQRMQKFAMQEHFSWEDSAKEYEKVYLFALQHKRGNNYEI